MNMSFDQMRNEVAPASRTMPMPMGGRGGMTSMLTHGGGGGSMGNMLTMMGGSGPPPTAQVPDHAQELQVYFHGPGADGLAQGSGGSDNTVDPKQAAAACKGKRDFILFEDLD